MNVYQVIKEKGAKDSRQVAVNLPEKYAGFLGRLTPVQRADYVIGLIDADLQKNRAKLTETGIPVSLDQLEVFSKEPDGALVDVKSNKSGKV